MIRLGEGQLGNGESCALGERGKSRLKFASRDHFVVDELRKEEGSFFPPTFKEGCSDKELHLISKYVCEVHIE